MKRIITLLVLLALMCSGVAFAGEKEVLTAQLAYRNMEINTIAADVRALEAQWNSYQQQLQRAQAAKARTEQRLKQIEAEEAGGDVGP